MLNTDTKVVLVYHLIYNTYVFFSEADHRSIELMFLAKYIKRKVERINLNPGFQLYSLNRLNISRLELINNNLNSLKNNGGLVKDCNLASLSVTHNNNVYIDPKAISNITILSPNKNFTRL